MRFFLRYPAEILEKFKDQTFLLKKTTKEILKKLIEKGGKMRDNKFLKNFEEILVKYQVAKEKIQRIFAYNVQEKLFYLDIKDCKEKMLIKAEKVMQACLKKLRDVFQQEIEVLIQNYEGNLKKLIHEPESEEQLMQLRILIEKRGEFLEDMSLKAEFLKKILEIFDIYFYEIPVNFS